MTPEEKKSLQKSLGHLDYQIGLLETWCRRSDTHPGLRGQVKLVREQFDDVAKKLPPID